MKSPSPRVQSASHYAQHLFGHEFAVEVSKHAEVHEQLLRRLSAAAATGNRRKVRQAQDALFRSYSSILVCLVHCLNQDSGLSPDAVKKSAAQLDPYQDCGEEIICWAEPKGSGNGWRPICSFGPKRQALHLLVVDILGARFGTDEINYLAAGRGAERASDRIVHLVEEEQFSVFVLADIQDFFRSVQQGGVCAVTGLPQNVVRHSIFVSEVKAFSMSGGFPPNVSLSTIPIEPLVGAAQRGLPQGSRASQVVAAILLGPALRNIISAECAVFYGDDIALAANKLSEGEALKEALVGILKSHPAGPFQLKRCETKHIQEGFSFLQYHHRRDLFINRVRRRPANVSYFRYQRRVSTLFATFKAKEAFKRTAHYRWRWMRSFRRWHWNWLSKLMLWQTTLEGMRQGQNEKSKVL